MIDMEQSPWDIVQQMVMQNVKHRTKDFRLGEMGWGDMSKHLMDEVKELLDAEGMDSRRSELADVLGIVIHMAIYLSMTRKSFTDRVRRKLKERFEVDDVPQRSEAMPPPDIKSPADWDKLPWDKLLDEIERRMNMRAKEWAASYIKRPAEPRYTVAGMPVTPPCCICHWTNCGCLNLGDPNGPPRWVCHGCIKREFDKTRPCQETPAADKDPAR